MVLTASNGKTKYYAGNQLQTIDIPDGQHGAAEIPVKVTATVAAGGDLTQSLASIYDDGLTSFTLRVRAKASSQVRVDDATTEGTHDYSTGVGTSYVDFTCNLVAAGTTSVWNAASMKVTASIAGRDGVEELAAYTADQRTVELVLGTGTGNDFEAGLASA